MVIEIEQATETRTLVIVEHEEAVKGYQLGRHWLLGKEWEGSTPGTNYLIDNLKTIAERGLLSGKHDDWLKRIRKPLCSIHAATITHMRGKKTP